MQNLKIPNFEFRNVGLNRNLKIQVFVAQLTISQHCQVPELRSTGHSLSWLRPGDAQTLDSNEREIFAEKLFSVSAGLDQKKQERAAV